MSDDRFLGSAVEKGVIRFTSVSQIKTFAPESDGCPRKWAFHYVLKKRLAKTKVLTEGDDFAQKFEHYLKTAEEVLPPVLQPAKHLFPLPGADLEVEKHFATGERGKDIEKAIEARKQLLSIGNWFMYKDQVSRLKAEIRQYAGLVVHDIPVDGKADVRHRRGVFVDEDGKLRGEVPGMVVVETGDLKTVSRIHPEKIKSGENAGTILPAYTKTAAEICDDVQMLGYGIYGADHNPDSTHQRLSHYYANKKKREAVKRTGLISNDQLRERWRRVEGIVLKMIDVAQADRIEDVEPNLRACDSFTHVDPTDPTGKRQLKGCGHKYYCPLSTEQVSVTLFGASLIKEKNHMAQSAFDMLDGAPPPPNGAYAAPQPSLDAVSYVAAVEAEKQRLAAAFVVPTPPAPINYCASCSSPLTSENSSRLQSGELKHIGCVKTATPISSAPPIPPPSPPSTVVVGVKPPDAPKADWIDQARPMPAEEIAKVEDPELRKKLEDHAQLWTEREKERIAAQPAPPVDAKWCQPVSPKIVITTQMLLDKKFVCHCGKSYSISTLKPIQEGSQHVSVIPKHKPPKKDGGEVVAVVSMSHVAAPPVPPPPTSSVSAPQVVVPSPSPPPIPTGPVTEFVNAIFGTPEAPKYVAPPPPPPSPPPPAATQNACTVCGEILLGEYEVNTGGHTGELHTSKRCAGRLLAMQPLLVTQPLPPIPSPLDAAELHDLRVRLARAEGLIQAIAALCDSYRGK